MSWRQDVDKAPRSRHGIYIDGLASGAVITWLFMMLWNLIKRESADLFGISLYAAGAVMVAVGVIFKILMLRKGEE